jgi:hypothetical protein
MKKSTIQKVKEVKKQILDYKSALKNLKWLSLNGQIKFNYLAGINRPINPGQVTKLAKSLEKMQILRPVVVAELSFISGKTEKYIIDGQHIFNALLRLGWEVPYVTIQIDNKQELVEVIALLNASSKTWSMHDYVTAWSSLKDDYIKLNHYYQVYDLEISDLATILMNNSISYNSKGGIVTKLIKDGEFKIINEQQNVEILNNVTDMLKIVPRMNRFENKYAIKEYINFFKSAKKYDHKAFIAKLQKNKDKFILATQQEGKLSELFEKLV